MNPYRNFFAQSTESENPVLKKINNWPQPLKTAINICFSSPQPMFIMWGSESFLFYNNAFQPFLNFSQNNFFMGKPARQVFFETWDEIEPVLQEVMATNLPGELNGSTLNHYSDTFTADMNIIQTGKVVPLHAENGVPEGVIVFPVLRDIATVDDWSVSFREEMKNQVRNGQILNKILQINTVGILFFDISGKFIDANDTFLRMIGYSRDDINAGLLSTELVSLPEWMPRTMQVFEELTTSEYFTPYEKELIRPDGSRWWGLFAGTRVGENVFVEFVLDITDKKKIEIDLGKAKESAEKALRAKDEFLSVMSHEMRTPLSAIVGLTNLLIKNVPREDQVENMNALRLSSRNMLNLINDILDYSKVEAGKMVANPVEFNLNDFMEEHKCVHQVNAVDKGLLLEVVIDEGIPLNIIADRIKLSRVLDNLLSNAIKFTNKGKVMMEVHYAGKDEETIWLEIAVSDTGIGIPEEKLKNIFDKFTQVDSSTTRKHGGTGLGLAITKRMLGILHGSISVESIVGTGSRFYFSLPVKTGTSESENEHSPEKVEASVSIDAKILIVEDAEINRMIISQFIKDWCVMAPDEAGNGYEAIEMVQNNSYDVILMDLRMPEMNGYEATRMIKKMDSSKRIPVIALTANTYNDIKNNPDAGLFDDIITKPFEPEDLRDTILKLVAEKNSHYKSTELKRNGSGRMDFKTIENQFQGNEEKLMIFYQSTMKHLIKYKDDFKRSIMERDIESFRNMQHNFTMLINLFKLEELNQCLQHVRKQLEVPDSVIQGATIEEGERLFDLGIEDLNKKLK